MPNNNKATFVTFVARDGRKVDYLLNHETLSSDDLPIVVAMAHDKLSYSEKELAQHNHAARVDWALAATSS